MKLRHRRRAIAAYRLVVSGEVALLHNRHCGQNIVDEVMQGTARMQKAYGDITYLNHS